MPPVRPVLRGPEPLTRDHDTALFKCGVPSLDAYLKEQALADARAGKSHTQVATRGHAVVAYYSLAAGSVEAAEAGTRAARGQGAQPIPVVLLARLAVDRDEQGQGIGSWMLLEALTRSAEAADIIGVRAVLVHALDERARGFYERAGFEPSPTHPLHLLMLVKDIRRTLGL